MPNSFAYLVLFSWPIVVFLLFRRLPLPTALAWSIIAGYLLLPGLTGINLPLVPTIDKDGVPSLTAGLLCLLVAGAVASAARRKARLAARTAASGEHARLAETGLPPFDIPTWRSSLGGKIVTALIVLAVAGVFLTVLQNGELLVFGSRVIPGLRLYDAFSVIGALLIALLPFLLGRRYLATPEAQLTLLRVLCIAGLGYSLLALYEVRMSPQLNVKIYGFSNSPWRQQVRDGGFRPSVFLQHGLWLGIFMTMATLAAAGLWRQAFKAGSRSAWIWGGATLWLAMTVVLCKSLGAFAVLLLLLPAALFLGVRGQLLFATVIAGSMLFYPMLRGAGLVPVDRMVSWAQSVDQARAESLAFRFRNEDVLLERANRKPLAGWGSWGRNRVYNEDTGRSESTTDGMWIILIGSWGWLGYIAQYGSIDPAHSLSGLQPTATGSLLRHLGPRPRSRGKPDRHDSERHPYPGDLAHRRGPGGALFDRAAGQHPGSRGRAAPGPGATAGRPRGPGKRWGATDCR